jgi:hypothetical protein
MESNKATKKAADKKDDARRIHIIDYQYNKHLSHSLRGGQIH